MNPYSEVVETCVEYDENDIECGKVYFNRNSFLLKFGCLTCRKVYLDINLYCKHLSTHHIVDEEELIGDNSEEYSPVVNKLSAGSSTFEARYLLDDLSKQEQDEEGGEEEEEREQEGEEDEDPVIISDYSDTQDTLIERNAEDVVKEKNTDPLQKSDSDYQEESQAERSSSPMYPEKRMQCSTKLKRAPQPTVVKVIQVRNRVEELYNTVLARENGTDGFDMNGFSDSSDDDEDDPATPKKPKRSSVKSQTQTLSKHPLLQTYGTTCPACKRTFRNSMALGGHLRTHYLETNNTIKLAYKCMDCGKLCNKWTDVYDHMAKSHFPNGYNCKICSAKCRSMGFLKQHIKCAHLLNRLPCKDCDRTFQRSELLNKHCLRLHPPPANSDSNAQFQCPQCTRRYLNEDDVAKHSQYHVRVPEVCEICGTFTYQLRLHKEKHKLKAEREYQCVVCKMKFKSTSALSRHIKTVHKTSKKDIMKGLNTHNYFETLDHNYILTSKNVNEHAMMEEGDVITTVETPPIAREETIQYCSEDFVDC